MLVSLSKNIVFECIEKYDIICVRGSRSNCSWMGDATGLPLGTFQLSFAQGALQTSGFFGLFCQIWLFAVRTHLSCKTF